MYVLMLTKKNVTFFLLKREHETKISPLGNHNRNYIFSFQAFIPISKATHDVCLCASKKKSILITSLIKNLLVLLLEKDCFLFSLKLDNS
jgi:hypothetical protein